MEKSRSLNLSESIYFEIIKNKTASLLASACSAGAYSTSQDNTVSDKMRMFGEKVGIAFQMKDDLFDYGNSSVGKPTGNDIKEKKITLPLIYTLNSLDRSSRRECIYIIKNQNRNKEKVQWLLERVKASGGIAYAEQKMFQYRDEALNILHEFPGSPVRNGLEELVRYTTDRAY
jgi:octaprenyl-diphosphate synthase